jgi:PiT family inorganic phosphate transporter
VADRTRLTTSVASCHPTLASGAVQAEPKSQLLSFTQRGCIPLNSSHQNQLRMLEVDQALEALSGENPTLARVVEMHYFGGMTAEVLNVGAGAGFAMVFALLISAIIWNLVLGSAGVELRYSDRRDHGRRPGKFVAFRSPRVRRGKQAKASEVGSSLLVSSIVGFGWSALLLLLFKLLVRRKDLYEAPVKDKAPPLWIRGLLVLTCTGVSLPTDPTMTRRAWGSSCLSWSASCRSHSPLISKRARPQSQTLRPQRKPFRFQMDRHAPGVVMGGYQVAADELSAYLKTNGQVTERTFAATGTKCREISEILTGRTSLSQLNADQRRILRGDLYLTSESLGKLIKQKKLDDPAEQKTVAKLKSNMDKVTKFIPSWVKVAVALALGLGTMIGWKRIVVTVGEKIGKEHLTYAQGASAELVAMATILAADRMGLPVSTTHVLSSGVAGTMFANRSGLQTDTLRNLLLAWVLTLPVCVLLGAGMFALGLNLLIRFGVK